MGTDDPRNLPLGYLPFDVVWERLTTRPASVDALLKCMQFPGAPGSVKDLSADEKLEKARVQAAHLKHTLPEYKNLSIEDILICECYVAFTKEEFKIPGKQFDLVFGPTEEADITESVAKVFHDQGYKILLEVPIGKSRADIIAYRPDGDPRLIAVELKTKVVELKKCFAQLMDYQTGADAVYLATTPGCAVKYLAADIDVIDPRALENELRRFGAGLIVLDDESNNSRVIMSPSSPAQARGETRDFLIRRAEEILSVAVPMIRWSDYD